MKVLMVTPWYYPVIGGTESSIEIMSLELNKMGIHTDIMAFNTDRALKPYWKGKTEEMNGIKVIKIPALEFMPTRIFRVHYIPARFTNRFRGYGIIHFHNDSDLTFPLFSHLIDQPKIFHCHSLAVMADIYKRRFVSRYILRNVADIYITPSRCFLETFEKLGIPRHKIRVIPNGIDIKNFQPYTAPKKENLIIFVGRIDPKKGLHVLLRSLSYLEKQVQLVIIGPLSLFDYAYSKNILTFIKNINKKGIHKIDYIGPQKREEIIEWYQKASMLILPSLSEGFPMVILEALLFSTPVIASNVGGIPDVIHNWENGILVTPNNAVKLAESIQYLLENDDIRRKFGEEGRRCVADFFSSEIIAKKIFQVYNELNA